MEKVFKQYNGFDEAEKDDIEYYRNLAPEKKLEELEVIRENYFDQIGLKPEERKVKRVFEIVDLKRGND